jgi:hypothetical protein
MHVLVHYGARSDYALSSFLSLLSRSSCTDTMLLYCNKFCVLINLILHERLALILRGCRSVIPLVDVFPFSETVSAIPGRGSRPILMEQQLNRETVKSAC